LFFKDEIYSSLAYLREKSVEGIKKLFNSRKIPTFGEKYEHPSTGGI
jgi:hypothetical protein